MTIGELFSGGGGEEASVWLRKSKHHSSTMQNGLSPVAVGSKAARQPTRQAFAAILAAVREREGAYVWAAQVAAAQRAGIPQAMIDLLRAKGDPSSLPAGEADVTYIRQLLRTNRTDTVFDRLKERHGVQWLVELTAIANYYAMLCGIVNAFEVDPPPDGDRLPAPAYGTRRGEHRTPAWSDGHRHPRPDWPLAPVS